jgi:dCMP deaminase
MLTIQKGKRCNQGLTTGQGLDACLCIHAEENALLEAGRERVGKGSVLYCDTYVPTDLVFLVQSNDCRCPCLTCSIKITQVGISEVVYSRAYSMDNEVRERESSKH